MPLHEAAKEYLELLRDATPFHRLEPKQARMEFSRRRAATHVEPETSVATTERTIPVKDGEIAVRLYLPKGEGPFPVVIYFHGGGWVLGDLDTGDLLCRRVADWARHLVVSVDYRLAPEHPFPTPVEDSYAALVWTHRHIGAFGGDPEKLVVCGESAGGNLATVAAMMSLQRSGPAIRGQILIYPVTDFDFDRPSYREFGQGYGLDRETMKWFADQYVPYERARSNPLAAPLLADDVSRLPQTFIITAEYDPLRDGGFAYAEKLRQAGVPVEYMCCEGMVHAFLNPPIFLEQSKPVVRRICEFLTNL